MQPLPVTVDVKANTSNHSSAPAYVTSDRIVDGAKFVALLLIIGCVAHHVDLHSTGTSNDKTGQATTRMNRQAVLKRRHRFKHDESVQQY